MSWREDAECQRYDPAMWFDGVDRRAGSSGSLLEAAAIKVCVMVCPVQAECLEYAVMTNQEEGVWGGTVPADRRKIRQRLNEHLRS